LEQKSITSFSLKNQSVKKDSVYLEGDKMNNIENAGSFDKKREYDMLKKDLNRLIQPFNIISKISTNDNDFHEKINNFLKKLPKADDVKNSYEEIIQRMEIFSKKLAADRKEKFAKYKTDYLKNLQSQNIPYKIIDNNLIRVQIFEIEFKPETAQIRILFNKLIIIDWNNINSSDSFHKYENNAMKMIKSIEISDKQLPIIIKNAYNRLYKRKRMEDKIHPNLVLLKALHREMIKELFFQQLSQRKSYNIRFPEVYLPDWAFVYNLDKYRTLIPTLDPEYQLSFETGSQAQTENFGIVLNGLNPNQELKKFCYIRGSS
jgi:hypothetical protein